MHWLMAGAAGGSTRWCFVQEGGSDTREGRSRWDLLSVCASHWIRLLYNCCSTMYRVLNMCILCSNTLCTPKSFTVGNVLYFKLNCTHAHYTVCHVKKMQDKNTLSNVWLCVLCLCRAGWGRDKKSDGWQKLQKLNFYHRPDQHCNRSMLQ